MWPRTEQPTGASDAAPQPHRQPPDTDDGTTRPSRRAAVTIALLFLGATAIFLTGDALVLAAFDGPLVDARGLGLGVALQAVNAAAIVGLGVAFLRVVPDSARGLARAHLALRIAEAVVIVGIGAVGGRTGRKPGAAGRGRIAGPAPRDFGARPPAARRRSRQVGFVRRFLRDRRLLGSLIRPVGADHWRGPSVEAAGAAAFRGRTRASARNARLDPARPVGGRRLASPFRFGNRAQSRTVGPHATDRRRRRLVGPGVTLTPLIGGCDLRFGRQMTDRIRFEV